MMNVCKELEDWVAYEKGRYVKSIDIDCGYGATCWSVVIGNTGKKAPENWHKEGGWATKNSKREVYASECSFFEIDESTRPPNIVFVDNDFEEWPGLEATILLAIKTANELGL